MIVTAGAPDPTFGDVQGEKSQWQLSKEHLELRLTTDLQNMTRSHLWFDYPSLKHGQYVVQLSRCRMIDKICQFLWTEFSQ